MQLKRVVVTGLGALTPLGNSFPESWQNMVNGVSGAGPITRFDSTHFKTKFACEVKNFDPLQIMDRKEARKMDRFVHFAMAVAEEATRDSGILEAGINPDRIGVIWGSGIGGIDTFLEECRNYVKGNGTPRFSPFFITKMITDLAPGNISMKYNFRGPNYSTVSACASASNALIDAFTLIRMGKMDVGVSGGSEAAINEASMGGFNSMQALSTRNDDPHTASRPFDRDRDGFVMGEGAACIILEELEHARARGAKIYAEVAGGGSTADAHHITAPHPEGLGAKAVMEHALHDYGDVAKEDVAYINVHGTSTPLGDIAELKAIKAVFGSDAYKLNVSSTKSMTGHLLGAAGAVEAMATIMAVKENVIPPTINHFNADPDIDPNFNLTFNQAQQREVPAALSNTFGFGGHNASLLFKKYRD